MPLYFLSILNILLVVTAYRSPTRLLKTNTSYLPRQLWVGAPYITILHPLSPFSLWWSLLYPLLWDQILVSLNEWEHAFCAWIISLSIILQSVTFKKIFYCIWGRDETVTALSLLRVVFRIPFPYSEFFSNSKHSISLSFPPPMTGFLHADFSCM